MQRNYPLDKNSKPFLRNAVIWSKMVVVRQERLVVSSKGGKNEEARAVQRWDLLQAVERRY